MSNQYVLLVDDDADIREALSLVLSDEGYRVITANDGQAAIERLQGEPLPSLILLDLMMPRMDGQRFREEQLRDPRLAQIPVVVLSAGRDLRQRATSLGGRMLAKPIDVQALLILVAEHVDQCTPRIESQS